MIFYSGGEILQSSYLIDLPIRSVWELTTLEIQDEIRERVRPDSTVYT